MDDYLTSTDVARLLGVAPTSIKRWTQSGLLACVITPGRHRRFTRQQVEDFARKHRDQLGGATTEASGLIDVLLSEQPIFAVQSEILAARARAHSWYETAHGLGTVLVDLGERWARGEVTILEEHRASERFARALSACAENIVIAADAPTALLATVEGDDHTLALNLVELCLREAGWSVIWGGRRMPTEEIVRRVERGGIGLVGLSASVTSTDANALSEQVRKLAPVCRKTGAHLVLGGSGAWAPSARGDGTIHRIERFAELHELLVGGQD